MRFVPFLAVALAALIVLSQSFRGVAQAGKIDTTGPLIDTDNDGCTDQEELATGRDPSNPWDHFDVPPRDNRIRVSDILGVVQHYFVDDTSPYYSAEFDRSAPVAGAAPWELGPADGQERVSDILMVVGQYFHDCDQIPWCGGDVSDISEIETKPMTVGDGESWRDCFMVHDDQGRPMGYVTREAQAIASQEDMTDEQAAAAGYTLPPPFGPLAAASAQSLPPWRNYSCDGFAVLTNLARRTVSSLHIRQRWVTSPYTNVMWPPSAAETWSDAAWGWTVSEDAHVLGTYPIDYFDIANDIVARGETHATATYDYVHVNASLFGFGFGSVALETKRLHLYLAFNYAASNSDPSRCDGRLHPH